WTPPRISKSVNALPPIRVAPWGGCESCVPPLGLPPSVPLLIACTLLSPQAVDQVQSRKDALTMVPPRNCPLFRHIASLTLILAGAGCREAAFSPDREVRTRTHGSASVAAVRPDGAAPRNATDFQPDRVEAAIGTDDGEPIFIDPLPIEAPSPIGAQPLQAPVMTGLHSVIQGGDLVFTAHFTPARLHFPYDPVNPGGWMLQLFVNTDQDPSGYWKGYDYVIRGGEKNPDGTYVVRQTMGGGGEGGWGAISGAATL